MSEAKQPKQYTEEFKTEAVRQVREAGKPVALVAPASSAFPPICCIAGAARNTGHGAWKRRAPSSRPIPKSSRGFAGSSRR